MNRLVVLSTCLLWSFVPLRAQQGSDSGLGFVPAQARIVASFGVAHDGLTGLAVDGQGNYYVSARRATAADPHRVFEFDPSGAFVAAYAAPQITAASSFGLRDGAYDPVTDRIYWGCDRPVGSSINVFAFDVPTRSFLPAHDIGATVAAGVVRGLAYDGFGEFWSCDFAAPISAFDLTGAPITAMASPADGAFGLAWHPGRNTLWIASQTGSLSGASQGGGASVGVHLIEFDPASGLETGQMFRADGLLPAGSRAVAGGCEIHRRNGEYVIAVLAQGVPEDGIVELRVDSIVGVGCGGLSIDYENGNAYSGNAAWQVRADGLDPGSFAALLVGDDPTRVAVPGVLACSVMATSWFAISAPVVGQTAVWPLAVPSSVPPGMMAMQAIEVGTAFPFDVSPVLFVALMP